MVFSKELAEEHLTLGTVGERPQGSCAKRLSRSNPGYSSHSENRLDRMRFRFPRSPDTLEKLDLPLRSFENEWGPGQVECHFAPHPALEAGRDNLVLFRPRRAQVCRRLGYLAALPCAGRPSRASTRALALPPIAHKCEDRTKSFYA